MRILVWHWGRRGAGPRFAVELAAAFSRLPETEGLLSLSTQAEVLHEPHPPLNALGVATYRGLPGLLGRLLTFPWLARRLGRELARLRPDAAICAMPAVLDACMVHALTRERIPFGVVVHDARRHPGDGYPLQTTLARRIIARAPLVVALSEHVALQVRALGPERAGPLLVMAHPPFPFGAVAEPTPILGRRLRLLFFGRLRPYKGLDLLASALARVSPDRFRVRVVGSGPPSEALRALAALSFVRVENRWVPEEEIAALLTWADAVVLPYREASQSGIAPTALAAGRMVVATAVGGLPEQLRGHPLARLVEPNPGALAAGLERIAEHPIAAATRGSPRAAWTDFAARLLPELHALGARRHPDGSIPDRRDTRAA